MPPALLLQLVLSPLARTATMLSVLNCLLNCASSVQAQQVRPKQPLSLMCTQGRSQQSCRRQLGPWLGSIVVAK